MSSTIVKALRINARIQMFAVFGVGLGNFGPARPKRVKSAQWINDLNRRLKASSLSRTLVVASYGHTGNFIVQSAAKRKVVHQEMERALDTSCAVLTIRELEALEKAVQKVKRPRQVYRIRHTPGAVMQVFGPPVRVLPSLTIRAKYRNHTSRIVIALKLDPTTSKNILDRNQRNGGWGAVAGEIGQKCGGRWTARSRRTITGLLRRVENDTGRRKVAESFEWRRTTIRVGGLSR